MELAIMAAYLFILAVGGFFADHVFDRIKPLRNFIDNLPMNWD